MRVFLYIALCEDYVSDLESMDIFVLSFLGLTWAAWEISADFA